MLPRRPLPALDLQRPEVTTANFGNAPQLPQLPAAAPMTQPPAGINVPQLQGIASGVMDKFFKPKGVGGVGAGLKGVM